jgi:hypothetical protein
MNRFLLPALLASLASLGGCASLDYKLAPENADASALARGSAIVIASGGAPQQCISAATGMTVAPAGSHFGKDGVIGFNVDSYVFKSDFTDHYGTLSVFQIEPGAYEVYPYTQNPMLMQTRIPKAQFTVAAGEMVYIGEFFAVSGCGPGESRVQVRDEEARDTSLLRSRNPGFRDIGITKRIAVFDGYLD